MPRKLFIRSPKNPEKNFGPFDRAELLRLVQQGKLKPGHEVSLDRKQWTRATLVKPTLFEATALPDSPQPNLHRLIDEELPQHEDEYQLQSAEPHPAQPEAVKTASTVSPMITPVGDEAKMEEEIDLTQARKYEPSGKCGRPWMMIPLLAAGPLLGWVGILLGSLIGGLAGFILVGIPGMLADQFLGGTIKEMTGGLSVRDVGACIGIIIGAMVGLGGGLFSSAIFLMRLAHERGYVFSTTFGVISAAIALSPYFLYSSPIVSSFPENFQFLNTWYWWGVVSLVVAAFLGIGTAIQMVVAEPYCERCKSRLSPTHRSEYDIEATNLMEMAQKGAKGALRNLTPKKGTIPRTEVSLQTCDERCCAYLKIEYHYENYDAETKKNFPASSVKAEGFLDSTRARFWSAVLKPVKPKS